MKIYRFEIKRQLPNALVWTGIVAAVLWLMVYGFYPVFLDSRAVMEKLFAAFPPEIAAAFGFNFDEMFGFQSFSSMVYLYEGILGGIMAAGTAIAVFAREKQNKCSDFLLTKPQSRPEIFFQKLLCSLTLIGILNIPYLALFTISYFHYSDASALTSAIVLSALCLPLTQLVFTAFGIFAAVFLRRVRSASGIGAGIGLFAFLMSAVYSMTEKEVFKFISPLYYFSPNTVTETGSYDIDCVITAVIVAFTLSAAAYIKYIKADVAV